MTELEVHGVCAHCKTVWNGKIDGNSQAEVCCEKCQKPLFGHATPIFKESLRMDQCPLCGADHLYRQRDFNRKLGLGLVVVGVALAYWTWGISLLLVTLIDLWLYRKVGEVGCCYQCESQFRGETVASLPDFNLEFHDYYQNLKDPN